jgi:hypothetical protein
MPSNDSQHLPGNGSHPAENAAGLGTRVPQGFTVHSSGLASEYARELGWGINEEERTKALGQKQDYDGGRNYDYGAQDFGDAAVDTTSAERRDERNKTRQPRQRKSAA